MFFAENSHSVAKFSLLESVKSVNISFIAPGLIWLIRRVISVVVIKLHIACNCFALRCSRLFVSFSAARAASFSAFAFSASALRAALTQVTKVVYILN